MKKFFLVSLLLSASLFGAEVDETSPITATKTAEVDAKKISDSQYRCQVISELLVNKEYALDCFTNYQHYGPTSKSQRSTGALKIANYNLLHPGTSKALFKDYAIVAKIMNRYDVVAGLELLATVGHDEQNNQSVVGLLLNSASMVEKLKKQKAKLKDSAKIKEMEQRIVKLINDTRTAYDLYRAPGYLRILQELKKRDPSWALLLSPRGDSALDGSVEELTGYFYRADAVTPVSNPHCKETSVEGSGSPVACFISLTKDFLGKDVLKHFARRPFMASFKANGKKFTLVTSHVVFTYSGDEAAEKDLMMKTFGVESHKDLGTGINSMNFARFAEIKNTLDFMNRFKEKYGDDNIMYMGDTNLVSNNAFWPEILKSFPGSELLITEPTTLSPAKFMSNKKETNGVANDYDHFILDRKAFPECDDGEVYNYYNEKIYQDIESRYVIRKEVVGVNNKMLFLRNIFPVEPYEIAEDIVEGENSILDGDVVPVDDPAPIKLEYPLTSAGQSKMDKYVAQFGKSLKALYTVKQNEVVQDDFQIEERMEGLKRRVFLRQLTNPYYYRFMQEVVSDHFPVALTCKF